MANAYERALSEVQKLYARWHRPAAADAGAGDAPGLAGLADQLARIMGYVRRLVLVVIFVQLVALFYYVGRDLGLGRDGAAETSVILEAIEVPDAIASRGISATVAADFLKNALNETARASISNKTVKKVDEREYLPDIEIPDTGLTLKSLYDLLSNVLPKRGTKVVCRIICPAEGCASANLMMHVKLDNFSAGTFASELVTVGGRAPPADPEAALQRLFVNTALAIYRHIDPFVYAAYRFSRADADPANIDAALITASRLIRTRHHDAKYAHNLIGLIYRKQKNYDGAYTEFAQAVELDPEFSVAYHNLGNTFSEQRRYVEAARAYGRALEIGVSPRLEPWTRAFRADMLLNIDPGKIDGLVKLTRLSLTGAGGADAADPEGDVGERLTALAIAGYEDAIAAAERYKKTAGEGEAHASLAQAHANLAFAYQRAGQAEKALEQLRLASYSNPNRGRTFLDWGILLAENGRLDHARAALNRAELLYGARKDRSPKSYARTLVQLAGVESRAGNHVLAYDLAGTVLAGRYFQSDRARALEVVAVSGVPIGKHCEAVRALSALRRDRAAAGLTLDGIGLASGEHPRCRVVFD